MLLIIIIRYPKHYYIYVLCMRAIAVLVRLERTELVVRLMIECECSQIVYYAVTMAIIIVSSTCIREVCVDSCMCTKQC